MLHQKHWHEGCINDLLGELKRLQEERRTALEVEQEQLAAERVQLAVEYPDHYCQAELKVVGGVA